jgi:hypothetical protein
VTLTAWLVVDERTVAEHHPCLTERPEAERAKPGALNTLVVVEEDSL